MELQSLPFSSYSPKRLAVKLTSKGETYVAKGHPWLFSNSIQKINKAPTTGDLAVIFKKADNKLMALGLYDTDSDIRIKIIYKGSESVQIDERFFNSRIQLAKKKREQLLETDTNSYRLIYGESDGFPGLIADVYAQVLVLKLYSAIWLPHAANILPGLIQFSSAKTVVLRLSRKLQNLNSHHFKDGEVIYGKLKDEVVLFREHGVRFSANVIHGHKTGYFLDHRDNRRVVGTMSPNKTVLDVFSYAGGFSVHALANGAKSVTSLDISAQALEVAKFNAGLNPTDGRHEVIVGDAFEELEVLKRSKNTFDLVVIDPPSFAKQQSEIQLALKKYAQLAKLGVQLTKAGGKLVLASCSSRVSKEEFIRVNTETLKGMGCNFKIDKVSSHDIDHPIGFPEAEYLKCIYISIA